MTARKLFFWLHLTAGAIAGIVIGIMCLTGAALAFQSQLIAWGERDARVVPVPAAGAARLPVQELLHNVREADPETKPTGITISSDPRATVIFALGREGAVYADPYTGDIRRPQSTNVRDTLRTIENWHRVLALGGDQRTVGKVINGSCNIAFCFLALSGLYLWLPRAWSWRSVRAIAWFDGQASGKGRDFNWHNVIGLWCAPVLIVLTLTAIPMSFRWGSNLVYQLAGETPPALPAAGAGPGIAGPSVEIPVPPAGTRRLDYDALLASAKNQFPNWEQLTIRLNSGGGQRMEGSAQGASAAGRAPANRESGRARENRGEKRSAPQAVSITVKQPDQWPRTATTTLTLNPFTGEVLKREGYADQSTARQIRSWTRFLHTGEALGIVGQLVAMLACIGGCFLVYTGLALACRRCIAWRRRSARA